VDECKALLLGAACGLPVVDPLGAYKTKFVNKELPRNPDGTLSYSHADLAGRCRLTPSWPRVDPGLTSG
jgi:hypothetical protein